MQTVRQLWIVCHGTFATAKILCVRSQRAYAMWLRGKFFVRQYFTSFYFAQVTISSLINNLLLCVPGWPHRAHCSYRNCYSRSQPFGYENVGHFLPNSVQQGPSQLQNSAGEWRQKGNVFSASWEFFWAALNVLNTKKEIPISRRSANWEN